jgi:hypothetical protein
MVDGGRAASRKQREQVLRETLDNNGIHMKTKGIKYNEKHFWK